MTEDKASWHEPWPEHLQASFDGRVEVGVEQDEAPLPVFEAYEGCREFTGAQDKARR